MEKKQSSTTAEGVALVRAIEASRPEGERICYDPLARSLINGFSYTMSKLVIDSGLYARMSQGMLEFLIGRERYAGYATLSIPITDEQFAIGWCLILQRVKA